AAALSQAGHAGAGPGLTGCAAIGGGKLRHDTGSHVDVKGEHLVAGLTVARPTQTGEIALSIFVEHGEGNYDTYNRFANLASVHGKGDTDYTGAGLFTRLKTGETKQGHGYAEASARLGRVKVNFKARDLSDDDGTRAAYDSAARYVGAHVGAGYQWNLSESAALDLYARYLWTHQGGDTVRLSTGDPLKFEAVDSQRTRLGARWKQTVAQGTDFYLGAAWEREYDGKARAVGNGAYRLDVPDLRGDTGLVEAGVSVTPSPKRPLSLDFGIQGHAGKREGVTGSFRLNYRF
ncbi:MAG: autotransporter outer membrane beta-barrel domain-containing protein, partial [Candidatus Accumulibacter sp.]|nr:autotransporter outer membrane beta-barrel domain-containing protein [Accumulibacter sp.]